MLINEDFFDSEELTQNDMISAERPSERVTDRYFRYVAAIHYDSNNICDVEYFEKVIDKLATNIEHSSFSTEKVGQERYITFGFNHSFKNINESMRFIRIIFEALKRPSEGMWKFELVDNKPICDEAEECQICLRTLGQRWMCPIHITSRYDNELV